MRNIDELSLFELIKGIKEKRISCVEVMNAFLNNIKKI